MDTMINYSNFILPEIPELPPISLEYRIFWEAERKLCINGKWSGGYWMPGTLYFYINHTQILLNESASSKSKVLAKPFLRDIDWEFFRGWAEARGISGFEYDEEYTCHRDVDAYNKEEDPKKKRFILDTMHIKKCDVFKEDGSLKTYMPAREYMSRQWPRDMGGPLWQNEAKNFLMLGSRGFGKSYSVANGVILHEFTFTPKTEVLVGAGQASFSTDLLSKVRVAMDNLFGGMQYAGIYYPPPFFKMTTGSWGPSGEVIARYRTKEGGTWVTKGSLSRIKHKTFKDNAFAANGTRPPVMVMEEIGMFNNLEASFNASVECMRNGNVKFGSMMMLGTGGDFEAGGTVDAKKIFYDPETYDCVAYDDIWEPRAGKICYFVPAYKGLNDFKVKQTDTERCYPVTNEEAARQSLEQERDKLRKAKSTDRLNDELQNRPLVPSEAFLVTGTNILPVELLKNQKQKVESRQLNIKQAHFGFISKDIAFIADPKLRPLEDYPIKANNNNEGCVTIYEFPPKDEKPFGMYIAGMDPYRFDGSASSQSVGALYIYKRFTEFDGRTHDRLVASYVGRPNLLKDFHEQCRRLLKYYNATCLYENEVNNFYTYLDMLNESHLLADQPDALIKEIIDRSKVNRTKGIHMVDKIKFRGMQELRDWLLVVRGYDEDGEPIYNLHTINDLGLLEEMISYNDEGNFDRIIAFMLTIMYDIFMYKVKVKNIEEEVTKNRFWDKKLFIRKTNKLGARFRK